MLRLITIVFLFVSIAGYTQPGELIPDYTTADPVFNQVKLDGGSVFRLNQSTPGITLTFPSPTNPAISKNLQISNVGTADIILIPGGLLPAKKVVTTVNGTTVMYATIFMNWRANGWGVTASPVTNVVQSANTAYLGPAAGGNADPSFRLLVPADVPQIPYSKISDPPTIPAAQVPSDWNSIASPTMILNKPNIFSGNYVDLSNKPSLFSGSYLDLTNKPVLFSGSYIDLTSKPTFSTVATSGLYTDLSGAPTALSQFTNDVPFATATSTMTFSGKSGNISQWTNDVGYKSTITSSDITTGLGYTPATNSRILTVNGISQDLSANRTWTVGSVTSVALTSSDITVGGASPITTSGAYTLTLPTVNNNVGTFNNVTINAKGLATGGSNVAYLTGNQTITLSGDVTGVGTTAITTTLARYSVVPTPIAAGARSVNTAYQISATRPSHISISADISCNLTLSAGASGQVILEISPNGTTGWIYCGQISGSNTGALIGGINTTQVTGGSLREDLPAGYFWRIRTNNVTGTPIYTVTGGNFRIF